MLSAKRIAIILLVTIVIDATVDATPIFFGKKHEHIVIHVPYKVHHHTSHHHHIEKIPIYKEVPVIKHVPVYKEVHVPHAVHVDHGWSGWNSGWW